MFTNKLCKEEGCKMKAWSGGLCKNHIPQKGLKNLTSFVKKQASIRQTSELREFFLQIWKKSKRKSEVSGTYLGSEPMSTYFHHILPKEKYPEACFDEENIILLTLLEHDQVEMDMYRYEEINKRREQLKIKYKIE
jgi:hypothetical protein